ncbi:MAG: hypothetical protein ACYCYA_01595 [Actinomycetes bacterium]
MTTATASRRHRRASGAVRRLPSGRWQARYTGPDGALSLGTFPTKADQELAHEVSRMARGVWRDPRLGEQPLGEWFRGWIATRADLAPSTRGLYSRLLERWIDTGAADGSRPRRSAVPATKLANAETSDFGSCVGAALAGCSSSVGIGRITVSALSTKNSRPPV